MIELFFMKLQKQQSIPQLAKPPDDFWNYLQQSIGHPDFSSTFSDHLRLLPASEQQDELASLDSSDATSSTSSDGQQSEAEDKSMPSSITRSSLGSTSLADAFHDCVMYTQQRLHMQWCDWLPMVRIIQEMNSFVSRGEGEFWDNMSLEEQLDACITFAMAFRSIGVMSFRDDTHEVCFQIQPKH